jgi:hypothetical protein
MPIPCSAIANSTKPPRRFLPPWTIEETAPCFIVRDATDRRSPASIARMSPEGGRRASKSLTLGDVGHFSGGPPIEAVGQTSAS